MNVESIFIMAAVGAVLGLLGGLLSIPFALALRGSQAAKVIPIFFVVVALAVGQVVVVPRVRAWRAKRMAEAEFAKTHLLVLLEQKHPGIKADFVKMLAKAIEVGESPEQARRRGALWGEEILSKLLSQHFATTSDAALIGYVSTLVKVLAHLEKRRDGSCHTFLFGGEEKAIGLVADAVPDALSAELMKVSATLVEADDGRPRPAVDSEALIQKLIRQIVDKHGEAVLPSLAALENPTKPGVDKAATCSAARTMYDEAIVMESPENAQLLRTLLTAE